MGTKAGDRAEFVAILAQELPDTKAEDIRDLAAYLIRQGGKKQRLNEALCNGDYPCDNGQRPTEPCTLCALGYAPETLLKGVCRDCRIEASVAARVAELGWPKPEFQGDPRGAAIKLRVPSGRTNDWGQTGICVPE